MAVILHVCGTMGSGKTTLVRSFMAQHSFEKVYMDGRKAPIGYLSATNLFVLGSYDVAIASGCDTIKNAVLIYSLIYDHFKAGHSVIYEGLFAMNHERGLDLWNKTKALNVFRLTTPLDVCRESVYARRAKQGIMAPLVEKRFESGLKGSDVRATNYAFKLKQVGAPVYKISREDGLAKLNAAINGRYVS